MHSNILIPRALGPLACRLSPTTPLLSPTPTQPRRLRIVSRAPVQMVEDAAVEEAVEPPPGHQNHLQDHQNRPHKQHLPPRGGRVCLCGRFWWSWRWFYSFFYYSFFFYSLLSSESSPPPLGGGCFCPPAGGVCAQDQHRLCGRRAGKRPFP